MEDLLRGCRQAHLDERVPVARQLPQVPLRGAVLLDPGDAVALDRLPVAEDEAAFSRRLRLVGPHSHLIPHGPANLLAAAVHYHSPFRAPAVASAGAPREAVEPRLRLEIRTTVALGKGQATVVCVAPGRLEGSDDLTDSNPILS